MKGRREREKEGTEWKGRKHTVVVLRNLLVGPTDELEKIVAFELFVLPRQPPSWRKRRNGKEVKTDLVRVISEELQVRDAVRGSTGGEDLRVAKGGEDGEAA
jgi:hypothetical protein